MRQPCESCAADDCTRCEIWTCNCTHDNTTNLIRRNRESQP